MFNEIRQLEKALENGPAPQPWVDSELRGEAPSFTGNRKEFVAKLPQTILHPKYGECQLAVLDDSQHRKSVCYINDHNVKVGHRFGNTWTNLYKEMMIFLGEKGS